MLFHRTFIKWQILKPSDLLLLPKFVWMKKIFSVFVGILIVFFFTGCSWFESTATLSGKLTGFYVDKIIVHRKGALSNMPIGMFATDTTGVFKEIVDVPKKGIYTMTTGTESAEFYASPGSKLEFNSDMILFADKLVIKGDFEKENYFLQRVNLAYRDTMYRYNNSIFELDEKAFQKKILGLHKNLRKVIEKYADGVEKDLVTIKQKDLDYQIFSMLDAYKRGKEMAGTPVSKSFLKYEKEVDLEDEFLVEHSPAYRNYLMAQYEEDFINTLRKKQEQQKKNQAVVATKIFMDVLSKKEISQKIKDYLLSFVYINADLSKKDKRLFEEVMKFVQDKSVKKELQHLFHVVVGVEKGKPAPDFELQGVDGKSYSLQKFHGKPLLLNFYATWDNLSFETLKLAEVLKERYPKKFNIVHVSLDKNMDLMKKFEKVANVKGIRLLTKDGFRSDICKDYFVATIPKTILIDKNGKVINGNSKIFREQDDYMEFDKLVNSNK